MTLIIVLIVGIPWIPIIIYVFKREIVFRNAVTGILLRLLLLTGMVCFSISIAGIWLYTHAESKYLTIELTDVKGSASEIEYFKLRSGNIFRFTMDDGHVYILRGMRFPNEIHAKSWSDPLLNQELTLQVQKYKGLKKFEYAPVYKLNDGQIYGLMTSDNRIVIDPNEHRRYFYDLYHNDESLQTSAILIPIGLLIFSVVLFIKHKTKKTWKQLLS
ncbi:MAG: hypothetical protein Q4C91_15970 [Eubacteriales bacterium]|nr:hypothetical protein [Eubacteriales bacterium]